MAAENVTVGTTHGEPFWGNYNVIEAVTRFNLDTTSSARLPFFSFLNTFLCSRLLCLASSNQLA